jgi:hypothetical protein
MNTKQILISSTIGLYILVSCIYIFCGYICMDATFFASSSKLVYNGEVPYRDFFFPQLPMAPYIYGIFQKFVGFNIFTLRGINAFLGLASLILCLIMAYKGAGLYSTLSFGFIYSFNSFNIYNYSIEKMYSPVAFFLVLGVFFLTLKMNPLIKNTLTLSSMVIALGCRLTVLPFYVVMIFYIFLENRKNMKDYLIPILASIVLIIILSMPFVIASKHQLYHDVFGIHVGQESGPFSFGLMNRIMALFQTFRFYFIPLIFIPLIFIPMRIVTEKQNQEPINKPLFVTFAWIALIITLIGHFTVNWFTPAYQTMTFPIFALMLSIRFGRIIDNFQREDLKKLAVFFLITGSILTMVSYGKESIWYHLGKPGYKYLAEVTDFLAKNTLPGDKVLAFSSIVNVNANRDFAKGTETFPFTFTPSWDKNKCLLFKTVNVEILENYFKSGQIKALVIDEDAFKISFPGFIPTEHNINDQLWKTILENYYLAQTVPQFGMEFKNLYFFIHN